MQGKTILIVDDDTAFSDMLSEILQEEGARVIVEHDGLTGFNQAIKSEPDLIMMDLMMPRMSGADALEKIRESDWGKGVHVILLTNMSDPETIKSLSEEDTHTECLLKTDWTLSQLTEHIKELLAI